MTAHASVPTVPTTDDRLAAIEARLDRITHSLDVLTTAEAKRAEFIDEMWPLVCRAGIAAAHQLDTLESEGWLDTARAAGRIVQTLLQHTSNEEIDELADSVLSIKDAVRAMTQPEVVAIFEEAGEVLQDADHLEPVGPTGLLRASSDADVQRGLAVLLELLKHAGQATREVSHRKTERARGTRRAPSAVRRAPIAVPQVQAVAHVGVAPPGGPPLPGDQTTAVDADATFTGDGFLTDAERWTEPLASAMAADLGLGAISSRQMDVLHAARKVFFDTGASPNIRRLSVRGGVPVRELYQLFPQAPGKTVARLAGLPKPAGCV